MSSAHLKNQLSTKQARKLLIKNTQLANYAINTCLRALMEIRDDENLTLSEAREIARETINRILGKPKSEPIPATEDTP